MSQDSTLEFMKKHGIPMTREDYLDVLFMGTPPEHLDAEEEMELPKQFRRVDIEEFDD
jgi:hypothetical protein